MKLIAVGWPLIAHKRSPLSVLVLLSILLVFAFPNSIFGQDERASVKVDSLPVYAETTTDSDIVTTLARGKLVRITTLSITNGDGSWCSISNIASSVTLGFVLCDAL